MPIRVGAPKETTPGERRVALVPDVAQRLAKLGVEVLLETGAGSAALGQAQLNASTVRISVLNVRP